MIEWSRIEPWDYIVKAVASDYHRKYEIVEYDDIHQSLYQWFVEHPNKLDEWEAIGVVQLSTTHAGDQVGQHGWFDREVRN